MLALTWLLGRSGFDLIRWFGLFYFGSQYFEPYQFVTHIFMHGGITHLFFNMYALYMFGSALEQAWGSKRFLIYYFVTGVGAAVLHTFVNYIEISSFADKLLAAVDISQDDANKLNQRMDIPTVGASGAVYGVLLGFGMLFPNTRLILLFPPIPMKAKWFVLGYGLIELWLGFSAPGSDVAHFAHVGGMLFGLLLILYWRKEARNQQYNNFY
jgi:membrane associated rhomboid family serine protease